MVFELIYKAIIICVWQWKNLKLRSLTSLQLVEIIENMSLIRYYFYKIKTVKEYIIKVIN